MAHAATGVSGRATSASLHAERRGPVEHAYAAHTTSSASWSSATLRCWRGLTLLPCTAGNLGVYIDAFEWVEVPNTVGMSQFRRWLARHRPCVSNAAISTARRLLRRLLHYDKSRKWVSAPARITLYWDFCLARSEGTLGNSFTSAWWHRSSCRCGAWLDALREHAASLPRLDAL